MILFERIISTGPDRSVMLCVHDKGVFTLTVEDQQSVAITEISRDDLAGLGALITEVLSKPT